MQRPDCLWHLKPGKIDFLEKRSKVLVDSVSELPHSAAFLIHEGMLKVSRKKVNGNFDNLGIIGPGEVFGFLPGQPGLPVFYTEELESPLKLSHVFINLNRFTPQRDHVDKSSEVFSKKDQGFKVQFLPHQCFFKPVESRVCQFFLSMVNEKAILVPGEDGLKIKIKLNHERIADIILSSRAWVRAAMNYLNDKNLVVRPKNSHTYWLKDLDGIRWVASLGS